VILVQTIVLSFESIHPKESQLAEITQFLFQSDTKAGLQPSVLWLLRPVVVLHCRAPLL
jgi:hypothetical protein